MRVSVCMQVTSEFQKRGVRHVKNPAFHITGFSFRQAKRKEPGAEYKDWWGEQEAGPLTSVAQKP
ncbi:hypothetical protein E2C01_090628 [Portunus trituberculatus]|uniref:Uncharacterized protein n=1 Tax=Portunus trituberculatus TaxID=210409 RepID=A0A5B7JQW1_PORTR|nr:hypothetical protein [Portunus trituberculatus]